MATNAGQTVQHLGYFGPFMKAWGEADETTRAEVYATTLDYRAGTITADEEVREVSADLGIPVPTGW